MGNIFQFECWENYFSGYHLLFIRVKGKLGKVLEKALKRQERHYWYFLYEHKAH